VKIREMMRRDFVSFQSDDSLQHVATVFAKQHFRSAPVFEGKELSGIVSVSDLVRYFSPKKFAILWKGNKQAPMNELKKTTAGHLVRKPEAVLQAGWELSDALPRLVKNADCVPVMEGGRCVGIVTGVDVAQFFLKEFAREEYAKETVKEEAEEETGMRAGTEIDEIYRIVRRENEVQAAKIAQELGLTIGTVERLADILKRHHLVDVKYSFFKGVVLRRI